MNFTKVILILATFFSASFYVRAQAKPSAAAPKITVSPQKSSPAYAELLLRRVERESELEEFLLDYKDDFPKVKEIKFEIDSLQKEMDRILAVNAADAAKLSLALGKLMVRKTELETDLWNLQQQYSDDHPEVKRARRKIEIFEKAIKGILS
ncbi:MAG: hypothetical protein ACR2HG_03335 [Pyrinomonadaceae bacterium]